MHEFEMCLEIRKSDVYFDENKQKQHKEVIRAVLCR